MFDINANPQNCRITKLAFDPGVRKYSFEELAKATGDFSNNNRVGQGGSGQVYKGTLPNGKQVAIKRLQYNSDPEKQQLELLFENEFKTISRTRHPNIVEVVGYCSEEADRLIVYEFVSNKSLKSHLYVGRRQQTMVTAPIDWPTRMKIALGIAEGLAYLHEDCEILTLFSFFFFSSFSILQFILFNFMHF
ncbi:proline-rich receptor-like protein kinase PERK15 [Manihot esculenta]|uniref:proline-rich receptor-like protein kinase PERK15 n=1 Tax=Manihot esculenta TaxID=3983 RepID=UPI001CC3E5FC|nr:proline-rich receptor-like protein kinase PERK15 [Manihot esculenta]